MTVSWIRMKCHRHIKINSPARDSLMNVHVPHVHPPLPPAGTPPGTDVVALDVDINSSVDEADGEEEVAGTADEARGATSSCRSSSSSSSSACVRSIAALGSSAPGDGTASAPAAASVLIFACPFAFAFAVDFAVDFAFDVDRPRRAILCARAARWLPLLDASSSKSLSRVNFSAVSLFAARVRCRFAADLRVLTSPCSGAFAAVTPSGRFLAAEGGGGTASGTAGDTGGAAALTGRVHCPTSKSEL